MKQQKVMMKIKTPLTRLSPKKDVNVEDVVDVAGAAVEIVKPETRETSPTKHSSQVTAGYQIAHISIRILMTRASILKSRLLINRQKKTAISLHPKKINQLKMVSNRDDDDDAVGEVDVVDRHENVWLESDKLLKLQNQSSG